MKKSLLTLVLAGVQSLVDSGVSFEETKSQNLETKVHMKAID